MHQAAFPGEDISDRPEPESVAPIVVALIEFWTAERPLPQPDLATTLAAQTGQHECHVGRRSRTPISPPPEDRTATEPPELRGLDATAYGS